MVSHFENYINIIRNTFSTWNDLKWAISMVGNDTANENIRVFLRWETQQFLGKILFTKGLFLFFVFCILFNLLISIFLFCSRLHINCNILRLRVCLNCFLKTKFFCFYELFVGARTDGRYLLILIWLCFSITKYFKIKEGQTWEHAKIIRLLKESLWSCCCKIRHWVQNDLSRCRDATSRYHLQAKLNATFSVIFRSVVTNTLLHWKFIVAKKTLTKIKYRTQRIFFYSL